MSDTEVAVISAKTELRALILESGAPCGPEGAVWRPSADEQEIMGTPDNLLIFCPDHHRFCARHDYVLPEEVRERLEELYPPLHEQLPRISLTSSTSRLYFDCEGNQIRQEEYGALVDGSRYEGAEDFYGVTLAKVVISPAGNPEDVIYKGSCPEIAAELCKFLGGTLRVAPPPTRTSRWSHDKFASNAAIFRRGSGNPDAEENADILAEHDCICREDDQLGYVICHDPKRIAAIAKGQRTRAANAQRNAAGPNSFSAPVRSVGYLYVNEIWDVARVFANLLSRELDGFTTDHQLEYRSTVSRDKAATSFKVVVETFNLVFGKNKHRCVPAFQDLLQLWREHGEVTRRVWGDGHGWRQPYEDLWNFLDREAKVRKPRKSLMDTNTIKSAAHNRVKGPWDCPGAEEDKLD